MDRTGPDSVGVPNWDSRAQQSDPSSSHGQLHGQFTQPGIAWSWYRQETPATSESLKVLHPGDLPARGLWGAINFEHPFDRDPDLCVRHTTGRPHHSSPRCETIPVSSLSGRPHAGGARAARQHGAELPGGAGFLP